MKVSIIPLIINPARGGWWLSPTPLKNMSSSVGMMKFPIYIYIYIYINMYMYMESHNIHDPNHQPVDYLVQEIPC